MRRKIFEAIDVTIDDQNITMETPDYGMGPNEITMSIGQFKAIYREVVEAEKTRIELEPHNAG